MNKLLLVLLALTSIACATLRPALRNCTARAGCINGKQF